MTLISNYSKCNQSLFMFFLYVCMYVIIVIIIITELMNTVIVGLSNMEWRLFVCVYVSILLTRGAQAQYWVDGESHAMCYIY